MAKVTIEDVRSKGEAELKDMLAQLKKEQMNLRFQKATGELENTSRFKEVRKQIARILTVINQKKAVS